MNQSNNRKCFNCGSKLLASIPKKRSGHFDPFEYTRSKYCSICGAIQPKEMM